MKLGFPSAVPEIPVRNINEAVVFYKNSLGFTVDWGGEELGLAGISNGDCRMFLANPDFRKEYGNAGPILIWLNLDSKDEVNELHRLWSRSNARLISEPESKLRFCRGDRYSDAVGAHRGKQAHYPVTPLRQGIAERINPHPYVRTSASRPVAEVRK